MVICSRCSAENEEGAKFCCQCGNDLTVNVDAPSNEDLQNLANTLNQQAARTGKQPVNLNKVLSDIPSKIGGGIKGFFGSVVALLNKIGKKRLIIIAVSLVLLVAIGILSATYIIPFAPHYFSANSALKAADYEVAISEYEQAGNFLNTKTKLNDTRYLYAEKLYGEEDFYEAAIQYDLVVDYADTTDKLIKCGTNLLEDKEYEVAVKVFEMVGTNAVDKPKNYALGMTNLNKGAYEEAKADFDAAEGYGDSATMINACDLMIAEKHCKDSEFSQARTIYASLPEGFTYNGVSAADRIALLDNSQELINAMGTWRASDNYIESRNIYKRTGSWDNWYYGHDNVLSGQTIDLSCTLNDDNTFDIDGEVTFYKFDDYSSLSDYCKAKICTKYISIENVTSIPSSHTIDSYTTLKYSGGVFSIEYSERDNYSTYFYNMYNSSVTFGNR